MPSSKKSQSGSLINSCCHAVMMRVGEKGVGVASIVGDAIPTLRDFLLLHVCSRMSLLPAWDHADVPEVAFPLVLALPLVVLVADGLDIVLGSTGPCQMCSGLLASHRLPGKQIEGREVRESLPQQKPICCCKRRWALSYCNTDVHT